MQLHKKLKNFLKNIKMHKIPSMKKRRILSGRNNFAALSKGSKTSGTPRLQNSGSDVPKHEERPPPKFKSNYRNLKLFPEILRQHASQTDFRHAIAPFQQNKFTP
jgi:hypothetical protein